MSKHGLDLDVNKMPVDPSYNSCLKLWAIFYIDIVIALINQILRW